MTEPTDWKQKYRDSLLESEAEEKRWRQIESALRRLVGRLCAAGMGIDPQLDSELSELAAANRRNADAEELERLAQSLKSAVVAVDAISPVATIRTVMPKLGRWDATCAAAGKLFVQLRSAGIGPDVDFAANLAAVKSDNELATILDQIAQTISGHADSLARERLEAASLLADVTTRLEEMAGWLTEAGHASRSHFADSASVNDTVMSQVRELTVEVNSATELKYLQTTVTARLETVAQHVLEFRAREDDRLIEYTGRAERMRLRIADLEREAQDLNSKLDREKHGARLDPLTRLANRRSFDERFARESQRRSQHNSSVTMLLWDLDNFKSINDSYGHRAGDRVLQNVAACFAAGLRAEEDFIARIGGEEFVVLLTGVSFDKSLSIADELRAGIEALRFHFRGIPVRVTVSCGLTELRPEDATGAAFDRADAALYRAKSAGKNRCIAA